MWTKMNKKGGRQSPFDLEVRWLCHFGFWIPPAILPEEVLMLADVNAWGQWGDMSWPSTHSEGGASWGKKMHLASLLFYPTLPACHPSSADSSTHACINELFVTQLTLSANPSGRVRKQRTRRKKNIFKQNAENKMESWTYKGKKDLTSFPQTPSSMRGCLFWHRIVADVAAPYGAWPDDTLHQAENDWCVGKITVWEERHQIWPAGNRPLTEGHQGPFPDSAFIIPLST